MALVSVNMLKSIIFQKHRFSCFILLVLVVILAYIRTFHAPFVFDDFHSIADKARIRDLSNFFSYPILTAQRPLADFTFALNYQVGGLNVFGFHVVNTLIHILNTFLVYMIAFFAFTRLYGENGSISDKVKSADEPAKILITAALFTALFFALHPLQTQAVTYIVQRYTSLFAFFSLLCIWLFIQARLRMEKASLSDDTKKIDSIVVLLFVFSLFSAGAAFLSKQTAAMLPGLVLLTELIFFRKKTYNWKKAILVCAPVFFLFILFVMYSSGVFRGDFALGSLLEDVRARSMETKDISRWTYLITQFSVLVVYIRMILLPYGQNIDHMFPFTESLFNLQTLASMGLIFAIIAVAVMAFKKKPIITLAAGWFFIALSIESSIIPIRDAMFEHRLYLPMFAPALLFGYIIFYATEKFGKKTFIWFPAACLILILGVTTVLRNEVWRDPVILWKDSIQQNPDNYRAWANLGQAQLAENNITAAEESSRYSLKLSSKNPQAMGNLGIALARQGKFNEAVPYLKRAVEFMPESFDFHYNLGVTYGVSGKNSQAIEHYQKALKIRPDHLLSLMNLGVEFGRLNRLVEAEQVLSKALEIVPDNVDLLMNLGIIQFNMGNQDAALEKMLQAEKIAPKSSEIQTNIGIIHHSMGNYKEALQYLGRAVQLDPANDHAKAVANRVLNDMQSQAMRRFKHPGGKNE